MLKRLLFLFCVVAFNQTIFAADLFSTEIKINGLDGAIRDSYESLDKLLDATKQKNLLTNPELEGYEQDKSQASIHIDLRGIDAFIDYAANDSMLVFTIKSLNIHEEFDEQSTRVGNENDFKDYINDNKNGILDEITKALVKTDSLDPVTGGNGLLQEMVAEDSSTAYDLVKGADKGLTKGYGAGLVAGHFSTADHSQTLITLPLSYTHYFEDPRKKLKLTAPISYINVNGSKAYKGSVGVSYTMPMNDKWTLIPAARLGLVGSNDMGSSAAMASASVSNLYEVPYGDNHITLSNMVGALTTLDVKLGSLESPYDLNNQVIKNAVSVEIPQRFKMFGGKTSLEVTLANTQFFGEDLYIDNYTDIAVSMGTRRKVGGKDNSQDSIHLGLTYTLGKHGYKGGKVNFGYKF